MELEKAIDVLNVYTLNELFELNNITEEEVLCLLVIHKVLRLPEILPVTLYEETSSQRQS